MWLKTAVNELEKWVPASSEYRREALPAARDVAAEQPVPRYAVCAGFPTNHYGATNYWVDVDFTTDAGQAAPVVTGHTPGRRRPIAVAPCRPTAPGTFPRGANGCAGPRPS